jgi:hypothetical protein
MQNRYLDQIDSTLGAQVRAYVPEMERDVTGLEMIERLAQIMYDQSPRAAENGSPSGESG